MDVLSKTFYMNRQTIFQKIFYFQFAVSPKIDENVIFLSIRQQIISIFANMLCEKIISL